MESVGSLILEWLRNSLIIISFTIVSGALTRGHAMHHHDARVSFKSLVLLSAILSVVSVFPTPPGITLLLIAIIIMGLLAIMVLTPIPDHPTHILTMLHCIAIAIIAGLTSQHQWALCGIAWFGMAAGMACIHAYPHTIRKQYRYRCQIQSLDAISQIESTLNNTPCVNYAVHLRYTAIDTHFVDITYHAPPMVQSLILRQLLQLASVHTCHQY